MSRYHTSDPGLRVNHDDDEDTPNSSRSAIGFLSVVEGKKHMRKMTARRRFQRAVNKVRTINRIRLSALQQRDEQTPLVNTNGGDDDDDDDKRSSIARESVSGGDKTAEDKDATDTNHSGHGFELSELHVLSDMVFGHYVSLLLLFAPIATVANLMGWSPFWVFWLNFLTMIPLASILGDFTQEVALHTNQVIGGLVNATFGNIVEIIVGVQALLAGQYRVVQASMLGSILSNLLLVLGSCFFFGGLRKKEQSFNVSASTANMSLLALSSIALVLPTPFAHYYVIADIHVLDISRIAAVFLIFMYLQLLYFQLRTHAYLFEDDDDEEAAISLWAALFGLLVATIAITFFSQFLVNSINGFTASSGLSHTFVGIIILPIVGNAVEHITAVTVAMKDKMDLAMGGESEQERKQQQQQQRSCNHIVHWRSMSIPYHSLTHIDIHTHIAQSPLVPAHKSLYSSFLSWSLSVGYSTRT